MRPISELDRATEIVGLAFDIDDTVTRDGRLELEAFEAIWRLHRAGVKVVALTGRPLGWVDVVALHWPVDLAIGENGAGWVWLEGRQLRDGYFDDEATREEQRARLEAIAARVATSFPDLRYAADQRARRCDIAYDIGENERPSEETVASLVTLIESEGARAPCSSVHAHIVVGDWNKGLGFLRAHRARFGHEPELERWLFVGDSGNDAAAFELFPRSVGVSNISEHLAHLPKTPTYVTTQDRGRGFAELADHLLRGR